MTIGVGEKLPEAIFFHLTEDGLEKIGTGQLCAGKKIVLIGVPGAFTGTCTTKHIPGYVKHYDEIIRAGADLVAVVSVNDAFVMSAWQKSTGADKILHLADWNGDFARASELDIDLSAAGLGLRAKRFAMIVEDGVVETIEIEKKPGDVVASSADNILAHLTGDRGSREVA